MKNNIDTREITISDYARAMLIAKGYKPKILAEIMGITENAARHILRDRGELGGIRFYKICWIININPDELMRKWELCNTALNRNTTNSASALTKETMTVEGKRQEVVDLLARLTTEEKCYLLAFAICLKRMRDPVPAISSKTA